MKTKEFDNFAVVVIPICVPVWNMDNGVVIRAPISFISVSVLTIKFVQVPGPIITPNVVEVARRPPQTGVKDALTLEHPCFCRPILRLVQGPNLKLALVVNCCKSDPISRPTYKCSCAKVAVALGTVHWRFDYSV